MLFHFQGFTNEKTLKDYIADKSWTSFSAGKSYFPGLSIIIPLIEIAINGLMIV